jgi:hypothetical protein
MGQRHAPATLYPPGKTRYPLYRRLGGPQGRFGQARKISPSPPGFDPRTVQPVASRYTDYATRPTNRPVVSTNHEDPHYVVPSGLYKFLSLLGPSAQFWNTLCLCCSLSATGAHIKHIPSESGVAVHTLYVGD